MPNFVSFAEIEFGADLYMEVSTYAGIVEYEIWEDDENPYSEESIDLLNAGDREALQDALKEVYVHSALIRYSISIII